MVGRCKRLELAARHGRERAIRFGDDAVALLAFFALSFRLPPLMEADAFGPRAR